MRRLTLHLQRLHFDPERIGFAGELLGHTLDVSLRERGECSERGANDAAVARPERREVVLEKLVRRRRRPAVQIRVHHLGNLFEKLLAMTVCGISAITPLDTPDA